MGGGDAEYIAKIFLPEMERLDPENNIFHLIIVDGASYIHLTGEVVEDVFPLVHTIYREDPFLISSLKIFQRYLR